MLASATYIPSTDDFANLRNGRGLDEQKVALIWHIVNYPNEVTDEVTRRIFFPPKVSTRYYAPPGAPIPSNLFVVDGDGTGLDSPPVVPHAPTVFDEQTAMQVQQFKDMFYGPGELEDFDGCAVHEFLENMDSDEVAAAVDGQEAEQDVEGLFFRDVEGDSTVVNNPMFFPNWAA
jgi:hypothetical protein